MKKFQIPNGAQAHLTIRLETQLQEISQKDKRKGLSFIQLEGLDIPMDDWSNLIFSENATMERIAVCLATCPPVTTL